MRLAMVAILLSSLMGTAILTHTEPPTPTINIPRLAETQNPKRNYRYIVIAVLDDVPSASFRGRENQMDLVVTVAVRLGPDFQVRYLTGINLMCFFTDNPIALCNAIKHTHCVECIVEDGCSPELPHPLVPR